MILKEQHACGCKFQQSLTKELFWKKVHFYTSRGDVPNWNRCQGALNWIKVTCELPNYSRLFPILDNIPTSLYRLARCKTIDWKNSLIPVVNSLADLDTLVVFVQSKRIHLIHSKALHRVSKITNSHLNRFTYRGSFITYFCPHHAMTNDKC